MSLNPAQELAKEAGIAIVAIMQSDQEKREQFARTVVTEIYNRTGDRAVAVVDHINCQVEGYSLLGRATLRYFTGATQDYNVWVVPQGQHCKFWRWGDGGYINWAFCGTNIYYNEDSDKNHLEFHP